MSDFFQDVFNKTKKFANNAVDETKDAAQKAKLNNKISNEVQMIDRNMVEIGKYFYEQNKENPLPSWRSGGENYFYVSHMLYLYTFLK